MEFKNSDEVFEKISSNPIMTRAYVEPETKKHFVLRPLVAFCLIALFVVSFGFVRNYLESVRGLNFDAETNDATEFYATSLDGAHGAQNGMEMYYSTKESASEDDLSITRGYSLLSKTENEDSFEYEYRNEKNDYIFITTSLKRMQYLKTKKIGTLDVYIYANAITEEQAEEILASIDVDIFKKE